MRSPAVGQAGRRRLRYLAEAGAYLRGLSRRHQLLAVKVTT
jgi:hypothetical protein